MFEPRLGLILLFSGDKRRVHAAIDNVTAFTAVTGVLKQGDSSDPNSYVSSAATFSGNILWSGIIGGAQVGGVDLPPGNYRYFITGTYTNKVRTWYWDVLVIPKELTYLSEISLEDYDPFLEEIVTYEGDTAVRQVTLPGMDFSAASGVFKLLNEDVTSTYCSSTPSASGGTLTTHNIGGQASIPPGDYGYFLSGTFNNSEAIATWYYRWKVVAKSSIL